MRNLKVGEKAGFVAVGGRGSLSACSDLVNLRFEDTSYVYVEVSKKRRRRSAVGRTWRLGLTMRFCMMLGFAETGSQQRDCVLSGFL